MTYLNKVFGMMKINKMYCLSLESLCFFGASVYSWNLLCRFWELLFVLITFSYNWETYGQKPQAKVIASCFLAIYIFFSFMLGFALFHGIEKKSPQILRGSTIIFALIHIGEFVVQLMYWCPVPDKYSEFRIMEASQIGKFVMKNLAAVCYVFVLNIYCKRLDELNILNNNNKLMISKVSRSHSQSHSQSLSQQTLSRHSQQSQLHRSSRSSSRPSRPTPVPVQAPVSVVTA